MSSWLKVRRAASGRPQLVRDVGKEVAAAVAIAAADLDALLEPAGHRVELDGELAELRRTRQQLARRDPARQVALGQRSRRLGQLAQRRRESARQGGRDDDGEAQGEQRDRGQQAGDVGDRGRPVRVRVLERDLDRVSRVDRATGEAVLLGQMLLGLTLGRRRLERHQEGAVRRRHEQRRLAVRRLEPEPDADVGLAELVGDDQALGRVVEDVDDGLVEEPVATHDRCPRSAATVRLATTRTYAPTVSVRTCRSAICWLVK